MSGVSRSEQRQINAAMKASMSGSSKSPSVAVSKKGKVAPTMFRHDSLSIFTLLQFTVFSYFGQLTSREQNLLVRNSLSPKNVQEKLNQAAVEAAVAAAAAARSKKDTHSIL
jgi:hypothetical protein